MTSAVGPLPRPTTVLGTNRFAHPAGLYDYGKYRWPCCLPGFVKSTFARIGDADMLGLARRDATALMSGAAAVEAIPFRAFLRRVFCSHPTGRLIPRLDHANR
jgi:hypothetical protein